MSEEAKKIVAALRQSACKGCIHSKIGRCMHIQQGKFCGSERHEAADMIEHLSSVAEDSSAKAALCETVMEGYDKMRRERDAAVADLAEAIENADGINFCTYCKHQEEDGQCHHPCDPYGGESGWEWRGLPEPPGE